MGTAVIDILPVGVWCELRQLTNLSFRRTYHKSRVLSRDSNRLTFHIFTAVEGRKLMCCGGWTRFHLSILVCTHLEGGLRWRNDARGGVGKARRWRHWGRRTLPWFLQVQHHLTPQSRVSGATLVLNSC